MYKKYAIHGLSCSRELLTTSDEHAWYFHISIVSQGNRFLGYYNHHYTVSQKTRHQTLGHNFTNYYSIVKIFSLADSVGNLQQIHVQIFHHTLNMSLHYLVKYECRKMASF